MDLLAKGISAREKKCLGRLQKHCYFIFHLPRPLIGIEKPIYPLVTCCHGFEIKLGLQSGLGVCKHLLTRSFTLFVSKVKQK